MNQERIGHFISECRKKKKMTQTELAEKIGVSDKTISNWENARCMPDLSLYKPLCEELDITINDLISGELVKKENYQEKLEENIIETINYTTKKVLNKDKIFSEIVFVLGLAIIFIAFTIFPSESSWGSIYSILGTILSLIGFIKLNKIQNSILKTLLNIGYFLFAIVALIMIDFTNVYLNHVPPRFSYLKETGDRIITYKAPFYNVYRINYDTKNEYYIIDTKGQYTAETVPKSPFNRKKFGIDNLIKYQNDYIGNNSNTGNLINNLPLSEYGHTFEIDADNCGLIINYHVTSWYIENDYYLEKSLFYNTVTLFALIDNLEYIEYNFSGATYRTKKETVKETYKEFNLIAQNKKINKESFNKLLEERINDTNYAGYYFKSFFIDATLTEISKIDIKDSHGKTKTIINEKDIVDITAILKNATPLPANELINDDGHHYELSIYDNQNNPIYTFLVWDTYYGLETKEYRINSNDANKLEGILQIK